MKKSHAVVTVAVIANPLWAAADDRRELCFAELPLFVIALEAGSLILLAILLPHQGTQLLTTAAAVVKMAVAPIV